MCNSLTQLERHKTHSDALPMGGLVYSIPRTEGRWRVVERLRVPGQLGVNCGSGVFKHSCDRGPYAGSKTIADMGTSAAEI